MKILAFDTALRACSVAVCSGDRVLANCFESRSRGHAEVLIPTINQVCADAGVEMADLDRVAVTVGPGTFAGVRIGIAAARGLSVALSLPVVGVTTLEAVAAATARNLRNGEIHVTVVFDARRGQVYVQSFDADLQPLGAPRAATPENVVADLPAGPGILVGDGVAIVRDLLAERRSDLRQITGKGHPDAAVIGQLAAQRAPMAPGSGVPCPLYLRPPDAKLPAIRSSSTS